MIDQITAHHKEEYGTEPTVICSAPGKIDLLGDHGGFGQGHILSFAIDRRLYAAVSSRKDNALCFYSANLKERKRISINGLRFKREDRWANYSKGAINELIRMGFKFKGVNITLFSEVPMGIGLASSTAMTVATVRALNELFSLDISDEQVIKAAKSVESSFMGLHQNSSSPMASHYARKNHLCLIDIHSLEVEYLPFPPSSMVIVVTDSRVNESMSDEEKEEIDAACRECAVTLGLSKKSGSSFLNLKKDDLASTIEGLSERCRRVGLHFVTENARIQELRKALEDGMPESVGRIVFRSHESLRDFLEISCPELDWLVRRGVETSGVYGSRMIGSGYGGCTITLMNGEIQSEYKECLEEYDRIFGFKASMFPVGVGEGSLVHLSKSM